MRPVKVRDVMAREVVTVSTHDRLQDATRRMAERHISGCPVVDDSGAVVGILSQTDILEALRTQYKELQLVMPPEVAFGISFVEVTKEREAGKAFLEIGGAPVEDYMRRAVVTIGPDEAVEAAIQVMVKRDVNRLPVIEGGKLVGIVTRGDIMRGLAQTR